MCSISARRGLAGALLGAVLFLAAGGGAASGREHDPTAAPATATEQVAYDVRAGAGRATPRASATLRALRRTLGSSGLLQRDSLRGGLRLVARRDGFLTRPSAASPAHIALDYVRRRAAFGLDSSDLSALELTRRYRSESGATHLQWVQTFKGIPAFDHGLRASVSSRGQLINVGGAPRPDLSVSSTKPGLGAGEALRAAARELSAAVRPGSSGPSRGPARTTTFTDGHGASLVLFGDPARVRLAWRVLLYADSRHVYDAVVDATSGALLRASDLVHEAAALAFDNYPGAPSGGTQVAKDFPGAWLGSASRLFGPNAHVYSDPNDSYAAGATPSQGDEVPPTGGAWNYGQVPQGGQNCPAAGCSWNSGNPSSWTVNRQQAGTQLFYFVNRFHDYLRDAPGIAFDAASGNFEGPDRVVAQVDNGATSTPACNYRNNASIVVPPDGSPPTMEMFLWTGTCEPGARDVNPADDALVVYHEYTHGLSSRLVTDASGFGALDGGQSGAMGEGWSDWYAMDFLTAAGLEHDTETPGELRMGLYENSPFRSQAFDCPVGAGAAGCPGTPSAGAGGYTYADFGRISGSGPEIHADGEIWVEALWDLRRALMGAHGPAAGIGRARALVTDGMRLSPASPTFLDMRNAILQADVNRGFGDRDLIWAVFAARGMGVRASTTGDDDTAPFEDFTVPPPLPGPPPPPDATAAVISRFSMSRRRFRVGLDRTPRVARRRAPVGSGFRFVLSEPASVRIAIARRLPGRRVGRACRPPTRRLRRRGRCTRHHLRGTLTRRGRRPGSNRVSFSGRIGIAALPPGRYRATISGTDTVGNRSRPRHATFTIVRG